MNNIRRVENDKPKTRAVGEKRSLLDMAAAEAISKKNLARAQGGSSTKEAEKWLKALGPGQP